LTLNVAVNTGQRDCAACDFQSSED